MMMIMVMNKCKSCAAIIVLAGNQVDPRPLMGTLKYFYSTLRYSLIKQENNNHGDTTINKTASCWAIHINPNIFSDREIPGSRLECKFVSTSISNTNFSQPSTPVDVVLLDVQGDASINQQCLIIASQNSQRRWCPPAGFNSRTIDYVDNCTKEVNLTQKNRGANLNLDAKASNYNNDSCIPASSLEGNMEYGEVWGALEWSTEEIIGDPLNKNLLRMHVGCHIAEGEIEQFGENQIAVLHYLGESDGSWEMCAIVNKALVFKKPPMIHVSRLTNTEKCISYTSSSSENSSCDTFAQTLGDSNAVLNVMPLCGAAEVWQLVPSRDFRHLQGSWRLLVVNKEVVKELHAGQHNLWFKAPGIISDEKPITNIPLVLCTGNKTYVVERNELDGHILIGLKFQLSQMWDYNKNSKSLSSCSCPTLIESSQRSQKCNLLTISLVGICSSLLRLHEIGGLTCQVNGILESNNGMTTIQLLRRVQASERELVNYLMLKESNTFCDCVFFNDQWILVDPKFWFLAIQSVTKIGLALGIDWSQYCYIAGRATWYGSKLLSVADVTNLLREGEANGYEFPLELPLEPNLVYQILLRFCVFSIPNVENHFKSIESCDADRIDWINRDLVDSWQHNFEQQIEILQDQQKAACLTCRFSLEKIHRAAARHVLLSSMITDGNDSHQYTNDPSVGLDEYLTNLDELLVCVIPWEVLHHLRRQELSGVTGGMNTRRNGKVEDKWNEVDDFLDVYKAKQDEESLGFCDDAYQPCTEGFEELDMHENGEWRELLEDTRRKSKFVATGNLSIMQGNCFFQPSDGRLYYLPQYELPRTLRERLVCLFLKKPRWTQGELQAFLGPILLPGGKSLIEIVAGPPLRHCRTRLYKIVRPPGQLCVFFNWNLPLPQPEFGVA